MITIKVSEQDANMIQRALKTSAALEITESGESGKLNVPIGIRVSAGMGRSAAPATADTLIRLANSVETLVLANKRR